MKNQITTKVSDKIEVGTILYSSWGYEQTNIDFYAVVKVSDSCKSCQLQKMTSIRTKDLGFLQNSVKAGKIIETSNPFRRNVKNYNGKPYLKINSFEFAYLWEGDELSESHYA